MPVHAGAGQARSSSQVLLCPRHSTARPANGNAVCRSLRSWGERTAVKPRWRGSPTARSPPRRGLILGHSSRRSVSPSSERGLDDIQCEAQLFPSCWLPVPLPGWMDHGWQMQSDTPSQHTSPWTAPVPAPWCSPGPRGQLAAVTKRGEMHLRTKNKALVIALESWAMPKDLGVSPQDHWHRHGTSSQVNHVMDTYTIRRTALHLYSKPHIPQSINAPY